MPTIERNKEIGDIVARYPGPRRSYLFALAVSALTGWPDCLGILTDFEDAPMCAFCWAREIGPDMVVTADGVLPLNDLLRSYDFNEDSESIDHVDTGILLNAFNGDRMPAIADLTQAFTDVRRLVALGHCRITIAHPDMTAEQLLDALLQEAA